MTKINDSKRVQVSFTKKQWELIKNLKGEFGNADADIVRNLALAWLSEKSLISSSAKKRMGVNK